MPGVILKPGKEKSILKRHPWIFSGAIATLPSFQDGDILPVYSHDKKQLASAYFHTKNSIAGRILSFGEEPPHQALARNIKEALELRKNLLETSAKRLINAEGDGLPGLVVDQYNDVLVIQINTCGIEKLKPFILKILIEELNPSSIYEKSHSGARKQEGLPDSRSLLYGKLIPEVTIHENGIPYIVSITEGQKTGFFLDQREMRKKITTLSHGKRVLNCFAYSGGFSLSALKGGACHVDSIEISPEACALCRRNTFDATRHTIIQADVFDFIKTSPLSYDIVILDPPAFAKKRGDIDPACQGYKEINRRVLQKMPPGALLLTSSCSSYITVDLFQNLIFQAALEADRFVRIIGRHIQACDHPIALTHPEGDYLKSLLLY
jgi:23S rRNA (cytosine1962-C5)-methyltransferase